MDGGVRHRECAECDIEEGSPDVGARDVPLGGAPLAHEGTWARRRDVRTQAWVSLSLSRQRPR